MYHTILTQNNQIHLMKIIALAPIAADEIISS